LWRMPGEARLSCRGCWGIVVAGVVGRACVKDASHGSCKGAKRPRTFYPHCSMTMYPNQYDDQDQTESEVAISRLRRITQLATDPDSGDLEGWVHNTLQRWWMTHHPLIQDADVRAVFCDAVDAAIVHLSHARALCHLINPVAADLRRGESGTTAMARFVMIALGLDPDATPFSLLRHDWQQVADSCGDDADCDAATYVSVLTRQTLQMLADPELLHGERTDLISAAVEGLRTVALSRSQSHEVWSAVTVTLWEFGDGDVALTARLFVVLDLLEAIAEAPY
jgi:hypothetical protein